MAGFLTAGRALCLFLLAIDSLNMAVLWAQTRSAQAPQVTLPVMACEALRGSDLSVTGGSKALSAQENRLNDGRFCTAPATTLQTLLPMASWSGRYAQTGCGELCGDITLNAGAAAGCAPLDTGRFMAAATQMGHSQEKTDSGNDPQKRQGFAFHAQHPTAVASRARIQRNYGQASAGE
ncbi:tannase/feruloyl esterase family alpha/beta hydrolase [Franconibacter helveticus]|uniref:tannase/feruloyl esterase family alpha/beta hydrolase n=1 Tax=Franconibacter helveticus TaxID=357240 RepID=UPI00066E4793|nr:tannase/feruloyl esterase family alpha/beta hydrolase [Franconibacter helveticus]